MKNDSTFVHMRRRDHLGDAKMSKRHLTPSNLAFFRIVIDKNGFRRMKEEGQIYKILPLNFNFAWGLSYDLSKIGDNFTPYFQT